jgi:hypothetical protein
MMRIPGGKRLVSAAGERDQRWRLHEVDAKANSMGKPRWKAIFGQTRRQQPSRTALYSVAGGNCAKVTRQHCAERPVRVRREERGRLSLQKCIRGCEHLSKRELAGLLEALGVYSLQAPKVQQAFGSYTALVRVIHAHNALLVFHDGRSLSENSCNPFMP